MGVSLPAVGVVLRPRSAIIISRRRPLDLAPEGVVEIKINVVDLFLREPEKKTFRPTHSLASRSILSASASLGKGTGACSSDRKGWNARVMASHSGSNVSCTGEGEEVEGVGMSITCGREEVEVSKGGESGKGDGNRYLEEVAPRKTFIQR